MPLLQRYSWDQLAQAGLLVRGAAGTEAAGAEGTGAAAGEETAGAKDCVMGAGEAGTEAAACVAGAPELVSEFMYEGMAALLIALFAA